VAEAVVPVPVVPLDGVPLRVLSMRALLYLGTLILPKHDILKMENWNMMREMGTNSLRTIIRTMMVKLSVKVAERYRMKLQ